MKSRGHKPPRRHRAALAVAGFALVASLGATAQATDASWTWRQGASTDFKAVKLPAMPGPLKCTEGYVLLNGNNATISWDPVTDLPPGTQYHVSIVPGSGEPGVAFQTGASIKFQSGLLSGLLGLVLTTKTTVTITVSVTNGTTGSVNPWLGHGSQSMTINYDPALLGLLGGFTCPK